MSWRDEQAERIDAMAGVEWPQAVVDCPQQIWFVTWGEQTVTTEWGTRTPPNWRSRLKYRWRYYWWGVGDRWNDCRDELAGYIHRIADAISPKDWY